MTNNPLIFGVATNDSSYVTQKMIDGVMVVCPFYRKWISMLTRCYSKNCQLRQPTYEGCSVSDEWLVFSVFKSWMKNQDWQGKQLDKDLLISGNKIYSPVTCVFVSRKINTLLLRGGPKNTRWKVGACFHKASGKFESYCNNSGKREYLGLFDSEQEAHKAYCDYKYKLIEDIALQQTEPLKSALLNYKISEY